MGKYHPNEEVSLWIGKMLARKRRVKQAPVETYLSPLEYLAQPKKPEKIIRKAWVDKEDEIGYVADEWADNSQPVCSE